MVEARGKAVPPRCKVNDPGAVGPVTVTLTVTARALDGIPHRPVSVNTRSAPGARAGPPKEPVAPRVSTIRQGVSVKKETAAVGGGAPWKPSWTTSKSSAVIAPNAG